jgi:hypothetical protein
MEGKKILTTEKRFYPMLVPRPGFIEQTDIESDAIWEKLDSIAKKNKDILLSTDIINNLYTLEKQFGIEPQFTSAISYITRELFLGNISQAIFYKYLEDLLGKPYSGLYDQILNYVNNTLLFSNPDPDEPEEETEEPEEAPSPNTKQYTLLDALAKFPGLGNQVITEANIKIKSQVAPVRPTLTNWLKVYRDELGIGKHNSVQRARFLFESVNGKLLTEEERNRVHALVRSLEDAETIAVDTTERKIIFAKETPKVATPEKSQLVAQKDSPDIFERFQHIPAAPNTLAREPALQKVGTPSFGAEQSRRMINEEEAKQEKAEAKKETSLLQKIKSMVVAAPKANAPAPKTDFAKAPSATLSPAPQQKAPESVVPPVPMGTLTFSAKHVLPAEKHEKIVTPQAPLSREAPHQAPLTQATVQKTAMPINQPTTLVPQYQNQSQTKPPFLATPPTALPLRPVTTAPAQPMATKEEPKEETPQVQPKPQPAPQPLPSIFRIKPSRDD